MAGDVALKSVVGSNVVAAVAAAYVECRSLWKKAPLKLIKQQSLELNQSSSQNRPVCVMPSRPSHRIAGVKVALSTAMLSVCV